MLEVFIWIVVAIIAFLLGSIPFSYLISKMFGHIDIRLYGSGNIGATNVTRNLGIKLGIISLLLDFVKGLLACWLGYAAAGMPLATLCGCLAVLGHCMTPFLGFHGGKGVATSAGVLVFLVPQLFLWLVLIFFSTMMIFRYVSVSSMLAAVSLPILAIAYQEPGYVILASSILAVYVIYRHHSNIRNLLQGKEDKTKKRFLLF